MANCHVHWYGKEKRPGRKMGHINVCAHSVEALQQALRALAIELDQQAFPALKAL